MKKILTGLFVSLFITSEITFAAEIEFLTINCEKANIQETTNSPRVLYEATQSDTLKLLERSGNWYKISYNDILEGFIHSSFIKTDVDPRAQQIVDLAHTKIGFSYVQATQGPNSFDCSGLIKWLLKQVTFVPEKLILSNGPQYQVKQLTYDINLNDVNANRNNLDAVLKPGDVFYFVWGTEKASDHTALYVGDNYIIHAKGKNYGVVKEKISKDYLNHTCAVKRIFENGNIYADADRFYNQEN